MIHVTRRSVAGLSAAIALTFIAPCTPAAQPDGSASEDLRHARALSRAFQNAAVKIEPSVVHITQRNRVLVRRGFFDPGETRLRETGLGSGVVVRTDGYILTNYHVIADAEQLSVKLTKQDNELPARIVGVDQPTDLAVLKVDAGNLTAAEFGDSDSLQVGEWVLAAGSPFGFDNTVTAGIVSATGRGKGLATQTDERFDEFIQTDAAVNPGNSGGPLIDLEGKVVGINNQIATRTGGSVGLGFAIPSSIARPVVEALIQTGRVERGWLGVAWSDREDGEGVLIDSVVEGSPADEAGLKAGDVIWRFSGRPTTSVGRFRSAIAFTPPGTPATVEILRDGRPQTFTVRLVDRATGQGGRSYWDLGFAVIPFTQADAQRLSFPLEATGAIVTDLVLNSPAAASDLRKQDVIVAVSGRPTETIEELDRLMKTVERGQSVRLGVIGLRPQGFGPPSWTRGYIDIIRP